MKKLLIACGILLGSLASAGGIGNLPETVRHFSDGMRNILPDAADVIPNGRGRYTVRNAKQQTIGTLFLEQITDDERQMGYAGTIWRDLDLEPLRRAAQAHPDCAFVLVGRAENNPQLGALKALNNVALLGERAPAELPDYLGRFDVCLNLLRRAREDSDVLSPRIYEYLSTGKPIVSMVAGDQVEPFPDVIYTAHTPQEFSRLCGQALSEAGDWARSRRRRYGADSAWSRRAEDAARILESIGLY